MNISSLFAGALGAGYRVASSEIRGWGLGVNQNLNEVVDVYLDYKHVELDATALNGARSSQEPIQFFTAGAQIKF